MSIAHVSKLEQAIDLAEMAHNVSLDGVRAAIEQHVAEAVARETERERDKTVSEAPYRFLSESDTVLLREIVAEVQAAEHLRASRGEGDDMTDREMLELAARAAGIVVTDDMRELWLHVGSSAWNPLTDDGDALRLAVKLGIEVWRVPGKAMANGPRISPRISEPNGSDIYAATRRAIVRAAAEIGRQMETSNG